MDADHRQTVATYIRILITKKILVHYPSYNSILVIIYQFSWGIFTIIRCLSCWLSHEALVPSRLAKTKISTRRTHLESLTNSSTTDDTTTTSKTDAGLHQETIVLCLQDLDTESVSTVTYWLSGQSS